MKTENIIIKSIYIISRQYLYILIDLTLSYYFAVGTNPHCFQCARSVYLLPKWLHMGGNLLIDKQGYSGLLFCQRYNRNNHKTVVCK